MLKKLIPAITGVIALVLPALSPALKAAVVAFLAAHPDLAAVAGVVALIVANIWPSPAQPKQ